jgi:hypothetical protein
MKIDPRFPITGWRFAGSDSYGAAELYRNIPRVVVKLFPEEESERAKSTYEFLIEKGIQTAYIEKVTYRDQKLYFYVFAEKDQFLKHIVPLFPEIEILA